MAKTRHLTIVCRPQDLGRFQQALRGMGKIETNTSIKTHLLWIGAQVPHLMQASLTDAGALPHDIPYFGFFEELKGDGPYTFANDGHEFHMLHGFNGETAAIHFDREGNPNGNDLRKVTEMAMRIDAVERRMALTI